MRKLLPLFALLLTACLLLGAPAVAAERVYIGSASLEMPDGFEKISDSETHFAWKNSEGDRISALLFMADEDHPYYTTSGSLIELANGEINNFEKTAPHFGTVRDPYYQKMELISVGKGECVAMRREREGCLEYGVYNRYEKICIMIIADDPVQYESDLLKSLEVKEMPLR